MKTIEEKLAYIVYIGFLTKIACDTQIYNVQYSLNNIEELSINLDRELSNNREGLYCILKYHNPEYTIANSLDWKKEIGNVSLDLCSSYLEKLIREELPKADLTIDYNIQSETMMKLIDELSL